MPIVMPGTSQHTTEYSVKQIVAGDARRYFRWILAHDASKSQVENVENTVLVDVMALCWCRIRGHNGYLQRDSGGGSFE